MDKQLAEFINDPRPLTASEIMGLAEKHTRWAQQLRDYVKSKLAPPKKVKVDEELMMLIEEHPLLPEHKSELARKLSRWSKQLDAWSKLESKPTGQKQSAAK